MYEPLRSERKSALHHRFDLIWWKVKEHLTCEHKVGGLERGDSKVRHLELGFYRQSPSRLCSCDLFVRYVETDVSLDVGQLVKKERRQSSKAAADLENGPDLCEIVLR